ncbi:MAG: hypothetical protein U0V48_18270 [Anaerolineales bacterium]
MSWLRRGFTAVTGAAVDRCPAWDVDTAHKLFEQVAPLISPLLAIS